MHIKQEVSKFDKLLEKILCGRSDANLSFDDAVYVLTKSGFIYEGGKGSHQVFRHPDSRKMVMPRHGKDIKPIYIRQIRNLLKK